MAKFPEDVKLSYPLQISPRWRTVVTAFDGGWEQRARKDDFAVYDVTLRIDKVSKTDFLKIWEFYQARKGAYEAFYFFVPYPDTYKGLYVGVGNGSTTTFDLPGKSTSARSIYLDFALQSSGYSILDGGGAEGADRVQFASAPADGMIISCDFTGLMRIRCRFREDAMTKEYMANGLYRTGLELKGLKGN